MDLFDRPPDALDVLRVHGPVGVVHVDPVAHAVGEFSELSDVAQHGFPAAFVELGNPEFLDIALSGESKLLFDR